MGFLTLFFMNLIKYGGERVPKAKETIIIHMRVKNDAITAMDIPINPRA